MLDVYILAEIILSSPRDNVDDDTDFWELEFIKNKQYFYYIKGGLEQKCKKVRDGCGLGGKGLYLSSVSCWLPGHPKNGAAVWHYYPFG